ncbi:Tetratricopeptide repeat-containing protein [Amphritea atlantica]|uniref:Tetratricopeptide repeat-containing protein n=2 Tax=Amphritea atlantica TaxID=355243 RepID=A0A1H9HJN4_9GAMM|nr:Tetratricopeptide repeat-containing protein [Amphritea atlantica]
MMKHKLLISVAVMSLYLPLSTSFAAQAGQQEMMQDVAALQSEWARIKYQVSDEKLQLSAIEKLEQQAEQTSAKYADFAEPKIWQGIILSTDAGIVKGLSALGKVKEAKKLFEASLEQNPTALNASAHTSLGSLYYQVPGWPIAFGSDDKAEQHLKAALEVNPDGIDANYFYADFLMENKRYDEAKHYFEKALSASPRADRPVADAGRRHEIELAMAKLAGLKK